MNDVTADVVRQLIAALEAQVPAEKRTDSPSVFQAIEEFCTSLEAAGRSERTVGTYRQRLSTFSEVYGMVKVADVRPVDLDTYVAAMRRQARRYEDHPHRETERGHLSPATIGGRVQSVKTFFAWCAKRGYCETSPAATVRRVEYDPSADSRAMDPADLRAMIAVAHDDAVRKHRPRNYALLLFLADTGCRIGEAVSLEIPELDLDQLRAVVSGKTGRRAVFFTAETARALRYWLTERPKVGHQSVFVSLGGRSLHEQMTTKAAYATMKRLAERAGVTGRFNPHAIRHLVGQMYTDQRNLELARKKLGNKSLIVTARHYANQDERRLRQATEELSLVNRKPREDENG